MLRNKIINSIFLLKVEKKINCQECCAALVKQVLIKEKEKAQINKEIVKRI
jgi:hypothetical protein